MSMMPIKIERNQKKSNIRKIIRIPTPSTFFCDNYVNVSDDDPDIIVRKNDYHKGLEENLFLSGSSSNESSINNYNVDKIDFFEKKTKVKEEFTISDNKNIINPLDEINISYTRKKSEHLKKLLENKSHRSRVNSVFELSSKMMFNSTINNSYRNARVGKVSLLGLFELTTQNGIRPEGVSEVYAAELAVKHINNRKILPGYTLELLTNDTKVSVFCTFETINKLFTKFLLLQRFFYFNIFGQKQ